jgi:transglutaminase-like putative cysteine protease
LNYEITHKTTYAYQNSVSHCHSKIWLMPRVLPYQKCVNVVFEIEPKPTVFYEIKDFYGNSVNYFAIQQSHSKLIVKVKSRVEVLSPQAYQLNMYSDMPWEAVRKMLSEFHEELVDVYHFKYESQYVPLDPEVYEYASLFFTPNRPLLEATRDLMRHIFMEFKFVSGYSTIATPLREIIRNKKGVCQDFAHLSIACLRSHGLAAKYVSGYIETLSPPGKEKLVGADASHAWFSVYLPGEGWYDFDPTNNLIPSEQHVTLAWGRDYSDVTPMRGVVLSGGKHKLEVEVDMRRVD